MDLHRVPGQNVSISSLLGSLHITSRDVMWAGLEKEEGRGENVKLKAYERILYMVVNSRQRWLSASLPPPHCVALHHPPTDLLL